MKSYLSLVPEYLKAHRKKTRLVIVSIAISVALVTGIFSMLDFFLQFEKVQQIRDNGNYHLSISEATAEEKQVICSRLDVQNSGTWIFFKNGNINGKVCRIDAMDESIAPNMQVKILYGKYPVKENEMALEEWAAKGLHLKAGDRAKVTFSDNTVRDFTISGIIGDFSGSKANDKPNVLISVAGAESVNDDRLSRLYIEFKDGVNVNASQKEIQSSLNLTDDRIGRNEYVLAAMGQSTIRQATSLYFTGAILFCIVLIAGVVMIYNTFNLSVMERVRQFGLLKCIGASQSQIKKTVRMEGLYITLIAIPIGLAAGMIIAIICCAILKFYNASYFGEMPLFDVSMVGIAVGVAIGFLTVFIASSLPAKKAARVSPINAVTGSNEIRISKKKKQGFLMKVFNADIAMGINNAVMKKKTLFLMSCSVAISIVMLLGFQVFVDFLHVSMKTTKPSTPDVSLISDQGLSIDLYKEVSDLDGVKRAYGRMLGYAEANFDASILTDAYKKSVGGIKETSDGLFVPPEKSWFISYDQNQLNWAKENLIEGDLSEEKLNKQNGLIAVVMPVRKGISMETAAFSLGDKVYVKTPGGTKEMMVMAILRTVPFDDPNPSVTAFITTEKLFTELTGESSLKIIDIQVHKQGQEQTINIIQSMIDKSVTLSDQRQKNNEVDQAFMTMAVFIYGFVVVIAIISILNIINTMNTSVASKKQYLGVMRAVGMSGDQLTKMVFMEATTYGLLGSLAGCMLGIGLQKVLITKILSQYHIAWHFPLMQIVLIVVVVLLVTVFAVTGPLKRINAQGVAEVIGSF